MWPMWPIDVEQLPAVGQILFNVPAVELSYSRRLDHIFSGRWRFLDALGPLCISSRVLHMYPCSCKLRRATSCKIRSHSQSGAVMPFVQVCFTAIQNATRAISKINRLVFIFIFCFYFLHAAICSPSWNPRHDQQISVLHKVLRLPWSVLFLHALGHKGTVSASGRWRAGATWIAFRSLLAFNWGCPWGSPPNLMGWKLPVQDQDVAAQYAETNRLPRIRPQMMTLPLSSNFEFFVGSSLLCQFNSRTGASILTGSWAEV